MEQTRAVQRTGHEGNFLYIFDICISEYKSSRTKERAKEILVLESSYSEWSGKVRIFDGDENAKAPFSADVPATTLIRLIRSLRWRTADSQPPDQHDPVHNTKLKFKIIAS
jgi:hypothetical protein